MTGPPSDWGQTNSLTRRSWLCATPLTSLSSASYNGIRYQHDQALIDGGRQCLVGRMQHGKKNPRDLTHSHHQHRAMG